MDQRAYRVRLERELIVGGLIIGFVIGIGGIYLLWGIIAAETGLLCFVGFLVVVALVWGVLTLLGWLADRGQE